MQANISNTGEDINSDQFAYLHKDERFVRIMKTLSKICFIISVIFGVIYFEVLQYIQTFGAFIVFLGLSIVFVLVASAINSTIGHAKSRNMNKDEYFELIKKQYNEMYHRY